MGRRKVGGTDRPVVREWGGTYIARWRGQTASCTMGALEAVAAVKRKVLAAEKTEQVGEEAR